MSNINSHCDPASGITTLALLAGSRNTTATRSQLSLRAGRDCVRESYGRNRNQAETKKFGSFGAKTVTEFRSDSTPNVCQSSSLSKSLDLILLLVSQSVFKFFLVLCRKRTNRLTSVAPRY